MVILRKWQIWKNLFKFWQKLKQDEKRGMSIIVGFTKMTYFAKRTGEFGKDWDNETTKQSYWQLAIFTKMNHDVVKPQMRWKRGEYWQKTNFDKYGECAKNSSRVWPNIQMRWQKGVYWYLAIFRTMTNFAKMANLARNYQRFCNNSQRDGKKGHLDKWQL